ncbi:hypothetical protein LINPERPRIM_LOCUS5511 [Linum perenne]
MIVFSWNCRGAGHLDFVPTLKNYIQKFKSLIVFILEPRISGSTAAKVIRQLDFDSRILVEAQGFSGGIWLCGTPLVSPFLKLVARIKHFTLNCIFHTCQLV